MREAFQYWLADMDDALERFLAHVPSEVGSRLDFSPESLDVLEAWILQTFESTDEMLRPDAKGDVDGIARYVGETYRKAIGGRWELRTGDSQYAYNDLPQLTGFSASPTPIAPHSLATAAADRRSGNYLKTVLRNTQKRLSMPRES